ncbi:MAG: 50S ribosomal protein L18 [Saprospirales bacterium]|jgi:large subunit ribosomal protein L18|nr:50S ribosomal protein L18 [Saprospirales bacterium]MBK6905046.1 50S ribosomal protein L18 [Saprospirales bacterium]MBK7335292.1 50S ribosomal protein L18 [Saprospirales bacterium]
MSANKITSRRRIQYRIRKKVNGTTSRPRLSVFRSNKEIYCQVIDDLNGHTLAAASSRDKGIDPKLNKTQRAQEVGRRLAEKALANNITTVVFDRGGYLYHGRVKALADGAREKGLIF